jgi:hypothetical protein
MHQPETFSYSLFYAKIHSHFKKMTYCKIKEKTMAKREFKSKRLKEIIKNIAEDFRYSNEMGEYALLFYKADTSGVINGADIDKMLEYVTTGLDELTKNIEWREEYLAENAGADEIKMLQNMKTIEEEYLELKAFLNK